MSCSFPTLLELPEDRSISPKIQRIDRRRFFKISGGAAVALAAYLLPVRQAKANQGIAILAVAIALAQLIIMLFDDGDEPQSSGETSAAGYKIEININICIGCGACRSAVSGPNDAEGARNAYHDCPVGAIKVTK